MMRILYYFLLALITTGTPKLWAATAAVIKENQEPGTRSGASIGIFTQTPSAAAALSDPDLADLLEYLDDETEPLLSKVAAANAEGNYAQAIWHFDTYFGEIGGRHLLPAEFAYVLREAACAYSNIGDPAMEATIYGEYFNLIGGMECTPPENVHDLMYAAAAYNHQDPAKALKICESYLRAIGGIEIITEENAVALIKIADIYYRNDLIDAASVLCNRYVETVGGIDKLTVKDSQALLLMASACIGKKNIDEASNFCYRYSRLMGAENTPPEMTPYIGHYYYIKKDYRTALSIYNHHFRNTGGLDKIPAELEWMVKEVITARLHLQLKPAMRERTNPKTEEKYYPISTLATSRALSPSECIIKRDHPLAPKPPLGSTAGQSS